LNWKTIIGILISAAFLYLAVRKVDIHGLEEALRNADYFFIVPVVFLILFSVIMRSVRWRYLMRPLKEIAFWSLASATFIGLMANNVLPARLGEFVRAYAIGEKEKVSKSSSFATIVFERILDGFTLLFFLLIVLIFYGISFPGWLRNASFFALVFYAAAIIFLALLKLKRERAIGIAEFFLRPVPARMQLPAIKILHAFIDGLAVMHSTRNTFIAAFYSLLVWLPHVLIIHLLLLSFGVHLTILASFVLLISLGIGVMIPSAPGFVGTIQYICVLGLALFNVSREQALSFSIVYHASVFIPVTAVGLIFLSAERLSFAELQRSLRDNNQTSEDRP
jgi:uncharacterized protein (TIRG00374 family)